MDIPTLGAGTIYNAIKDGALWFRRRLHKLTPEERLERREKWKERFREEIWKTEEQELRQDVIVRNLRKIDHYPETEDGKGISSWFRVALVGQYHRGILLGLSIHSLAYEQSEQPHGAWRLAGPNERNSLKAYLVGFVRDDDIENVDWNGDEYFNYPHLYCHFAHRGEPYEKLVFCERKSIHPKHHFYSEVASYQEVKLTSQKYGTADQHWQVK
jgi:hypothetical protein